MAARIERRPPVRHPRAPRINHNRIALLAAASELFAESGPSSVSIRAVSTRAGCSHTLIGQQFGSKQGLEIAVIASAVDEFTSFIRELSTEGDFSFQEVVTWLRNHPTTTRLMVRSVLGEFEGFSFGEHTGLGEALIHQLRVRNGQMNLNGLSQARTVAYMVWAMIFGYFSLQELLTVASRVDQVPAPKRDALLAATADLVAGLLGSGRVDLRSKSRRKPEPPQEFPDLTTIDSRSALIQAAIELYSSSGPASLTTREIADLARVNQGLIYHYFESREALLTEAIAEANLPLEISLPPGVELDLPAAIRAVAQARSYRMLARVEANGMPLAQVRTRYPVFDRLLADYPQVPKGSRTTGLNDPRIAVMLGSAMSFGSALWGGVLRQILQIPNEMDLVPALAGTVGLIFAQPLSD
jgi:AcrR family transcriptional regulator